MTVAGIQRIGDRLRHFTLRLARRTVIHERLAERTPGRIIPELSVEDDDDFTDLAQGGQLSRKTTGLSTKLTVSAAGAASAAVLLVVRRGHAMQGATGKPRTATGALALLVGGASRGTLRGAADLRITALQIRNAALTIVVFVTHAARATVAVLAAVSTGVRGRAILAGGTLVVARQTIDALATR